MSLSHQTLRALDESSGVEKFKKGMKILYEDEYDLLNKIQKNAKYENTIDHRRFKIADSSTNTMTRITDAGSNHQVNLKASLNANTVLSPYISDYE